MILAWPIDIDHGLLIFSMIDLGMYLSPERTSVRSREGVPSDSTDIRELEDLKFDWRDASVIGPIRDQHRVSACQFCIRTLFLSICTIDYIVLPCIM